MKHRKIAVIVGIIFILVCIALYIFIYTIPEITGSLKPTTVVEYGQMRISKTVPAVIVRKEAVHESSFNGNATYYIENNTKTRKGIRVLDIFNGDVNSITCPTTGVISYYVDGYESKLNFDTLEIVDTLIPQDGSEITINNVKHENIHLGDPIYKLITSDVWYTVAMVPTEDLPMYIEGSEVKLEFETGTVEATIDKVVEKENTSLVIMSTAKYFADYDRIRLCDVTVVLKDDKGLIVPNMAIDTVDGEPGVYVKKIDGSYTFTRIKIINSDDVNSVVVADQFDDVSTISIYDEILKDISKRD